MSRKSGLSKQVQFAWNPMVDRNFHKLKKWTVCTGWPFQRELFQTGFTVIMLLLGWNSTYSMQTHSCWSGMLATVEENWLTLSQMYKSSQSQFRPNYLLSSRPVFKTTWRRNSPVPMTRSGATRLNIYTFLNKCTPNFWEFTWPYLRN